MRDLRIGCVRYLNAQPLIHGWDGPVDFDHPSDLCRKLAAGALDAAFVSSIEYLRNPIYTIVDDVAVVAEGPVYSVIVAHRGELADVREIALDPASKTSINLLRCLLAECNLPARFAFAPPNEKSEAQFLIGDQAIAFRYAHVNDFRFWDLGEEWLRLTQLPFVFALWLIRPEVNGTRELADRLRQRRDDNLRSLENVAAAQKNFPPGFALRYFRENLRFHFGDREKEGLRHFRLLCQRHGILPPEDAAALRVI